MARQVRQVLPKPPDHYDQAYLAQLADAVNRYMFQAQAQGEVVAARFICTDPPTATTVGLATGTIYLKQVPGAPAGTYFLTVVTSGDPA